jgi:hypothetical protein
MLITDRRTAEKLIPGARGGPHLPDLAAREISPQIH